MNPLKRAASSLGIPLHTVQAYRFEVGTKIKFVEQKQIFTIQACSPRWLICTKPFNARQTVLYSIVDLDEHVRGPDNLVFSFGYETRAECEENLQRLLDGEMEVSHRRRITLKIEKVINK